MFQALKVSWQLTRRNGVLHQHQAHLLIITNELQPSDIESTLSYSDTHHWLQLEFCKLYEGCHNFLRRVMLFVVQTPIKCSSLLFHH